MHQPTTSRNEPTPPASPEHRTRTTSSITSEPSIVLSTTPRRSNANPTTPTPTPRRRRRGAGLRASPSLVIVDHSKSAQEQRRLRASPDLEVVDGPRPMLNSSQRPAKKKARLDSNPSASQQSSSQPFSYSPPSSQPSGSLPSTATLGPDSASVPTYTTLITPPATQVNVAAPVQSQRPAKKKARFDAPTSQQASSQPSVPTPSYMAPAPNNIASTSSTTMMTPPLTQPLSQPTPSKGKGKRKAKDIEDTGKEEEKRAARFKPKCPQNIMDRVERVKVQRLFMIDRSRSGDELSETFSVLGSTGNVYTVVIDKLPRCNCPDALKGNHCKHILFIFLKVLRVPETSSHWYQKALLSSELAEIFAQAPMAPNCVAHTHVRDAHAKATGQFSGPSSQSVKKRWPTKDDDCPICYESMFGVPENGLKFCDACGNALHEECWKQWQASSVRSGNSVTCVWCRAETNVGGARKKGAAGGRGAFSSEGYLNLASVAGVSPVRDTSTYYHGRWGRRYDEDFFEDD